MAGGKARLPPRWFVVTFWHVHRLFVRGTGGRKGLWPPRQGKWGALRLTTRGRRSGEARSVIVGYYEDGANLVSMAMNGWGAAEPAWPERDQVAVERGVSSIPPHRSVPGRMSASYRGATRYRCHRSGIPLSSCSPASSKSNPDPVATSLTVCETSTSPAPAFPATRAPM